MLQWVAPVYLQSTSSVPCQTLELFSLNHYNLVLCDPFRSDRFPELQVFRSLVIAALHVVACLASVSARSSKMKLCHTEGLRPSEASTVELRLYTSFCGHVPSLASLDKFNPPVSSARSHAYIEAVANVNPFHKQTLRNYF